MTFAVTISFVFVGCIAAFAFALLLARWVLAREAGDDRMREVWLPIKEGAEGFFRTQYRTIAKLAAVTALLLFLFFLIRPASKKDPDVGGNGVFALFTALSFIVGATMSAVAGYAGMWVSVRANVRVTSAATRSYNEALQIALRGGSFAAVLVVALSVFGLALMYTIIYVGFYSHGPISLQQVVYVISGYGFGASFVALFSQLGGGIYTKAADVGADLVGKVEHGIPEDDPRNPAVIADLVGDNVGDCAGRGADLFESIAAENLGAMIVAGALAKNAAMTPDDSMGYIAFPLLIHVFGILASAVGILSVRTRNGQYKPIEHQSLYDEQGERVDATVLEDPMKVLNRGFYVTAVVAVVGVWIVCGALLHTDKAPQAWWRYAFCGTLGVLTSLAFLLITQYYTDYKYKPVKDIAQASISGHGTNIIAGTAVGMESTALPVLAMGATIILSYYIGSHTGFTLAKPQGQTQVFPHPDGLFGTAVATMGMLTTAVYVLGMDTFGPISDNAGGIAEMSEQEAGIRDVCDRLDAVGNTTKALTKGYAIGSAALAAFLLFAAFMDLVLSYTGKVLQVDVSHPEVFVGALLGGMLVFLFSAWAIKAVGHSAEAVVQEVRRQFQERPGIMTKTETPDYAACVSIVARSALRDMVKPGLLPVLAPVVVGFLFRWYGSAVNDDTLGPEVVAGMLMIATVVGILMALYLNNAGGAWDNAKKYVETGALIDPATGEVHGKGSEAHKASVTGDTVGDPFKDTAGPSIHVLIKLLGTITLVLGPLFIPETM